MADDKKEKRKSIYEEEHGRRARMPIYKGEREKAEAELQGKKPPPDFYAKLKKAFNKAPIVKQTKRAGAELADDVSRETSDFTEDALLFVGVKEKDKEPAYRRAYQKNKKNPENLERVRAYGKALGLTKTTMKKIEERDDDPEPDEVYKKRGEKLYAKLFAQGKSHKEIEEILEATDETVYRPTDEQLEKARQMERMRRYQKRGGKKAAKAEKAKASESDSFQAKAERLYGGKE